MSEIRFEMRKVEEKREKTYHKGSIYDPIIDQFLESGHDLVEISVEERKASYMVTQLTKRIEKRELDIVASRGGGFVYLEKKTSEPV
ncbi:unnamed protein product [marine sediment metagenome]|uniref:Uncharacterized protein n=1 Tax=marine sediment metagenome TaxID=412755 RepID=X1BIW8_9ZZZZ